jgi:hypothetical protein
MRNRVSALCDGSLSGFARWYTLLHVARCPHCKAALEALMVLRERLIELAKHVAPETDSGLSSDRWAAVERAWKAADDRRL